MLLVGLRTNPSAPNTPNRRPCAHRVPLPQARQPGDLSATSGAALAAVVATKGADSFTRGVKRPLRLKQPRALGTQRPERLLPTTSALLPATCALLPATALFSRENLRSAPGKKSICQRHNSLARDLLKRRPPHADDRPVAVRAHTQEDTMLTLLLLLASAAYRRLTRHYSRKRPSLRLQLMSAGDTAPDTLRPVVLARL